MGIWLLEELLFLFIPHSSLLYPSSPAADVCYKKREEGGGNPTLPKCHDNAHWRAVSAAHLICMTGSD